jgi:hypothetical protein
MRTKKDRRQLASSLPVGATLIRFVLACTAVLLVFGCAKLTASVPPGTELSKVKSFYVVRLPPDNRGINQLIREDLATRGLDATTGPESARPNAVDVIVTYEDRWMWDITMYMLSLSISFRHPETNTFLASGQSYRPSLERKEPREMVKEILDEIFKTGK